MSLIRDKVYLVIGANRGIGLALVSNLAGKPGIKVIGSTRGEVSKATELTRLASKHENVHLVSIEVTDSNSFEHAASVIQNNFDIQHIDVLIMNAGIFGEKEDLKIVKRENFLRGIEVNVYGAILAYQAFKLLLEASLSRTDQKAVFASISSEAGNTGTPMPIGNITYTTSKAALNHVSAQINLENESIHALAIHPGMVDTDMSSGAAASYGKTLQDFANDFSLEILSPAESATAILEIINAQDVEKYAGQFVDYSGRILPI